MTHFIREPVLKRIHFKLASGRFVLYNPGFHLYREPVLQCVAVCCSVLKCALEYNMHNTRHAFLVDYLAEPHGSPGLSQCQTISIHLEPNSYLYSLLHWHLECHFFNLRSQSIL